MDTVDTGWNAVVTRQPHGRRSASLNGGVANDHLDKLRGDHAFIITPAPFAKSRPHGHVEDDAPMVSGWDFIVYPNPTREGFTLIFPDEAAKEVMILDLSGRVIVQRTSVTTTSLEFSELGLAQGAYCVRVSDGSLIRIKKLIVQ